MTDQDHSVIFSLNGGNNEPGGLESYDDFADTENRPANLSSGLVSLGFLTAAVRRNVRFLLIMALIALFIGLIAYAVSPQKYQATATVLLTLSPYESGNSVPLDNQAIAETHSVAQLAENKLGLQQSVSSFLNTYSVTPVTDRVLDITATGPSSSEAVLRASAVANAYLTFRASSLQTEQNLVTQSLNQQISEAKQRLSSISAQINRLTAQQLLSSAQQSQLNSLRAQQTSETNTLSGLQGGLTDDQTTTQPAVAAAVHGSEVLSVAPLSRSKLKPLLIYAAVGLIAGLALGLAIVIIRAVVSDRLRQRNDIAYALDAPVKLSVGPLPARRWLPTLPGRAAKENLNLRRVVARLQSAVPRRAHGPAGLAIVAVDNAPAVAQAVAELATSCARHGDKVVVADLSRGSDLARLLGVTSPGAHPASRDGVTFTVALPDQDDSPPAGPLGTVSVPVGSEETGDSPQAVCASADVLLSLVTLDPAIGGDQLATWATTVVVVVTAGHSTATRIHAVGEMVRLAGVRLDSVVLLGTDERDESLGLIPLYSRITA